MEEMIPKYLDQVHTCIILSYQTGNCELHVPFFVVVVLKFVFRERGGVKNILTHLKCPVSYASNRKQNRECFC